MRYKLLGKSGLRVSELCLGTMTFGKDWGWGTTKEESRKVFDAFVEAGGNFIDTANRYTNGTSEKFVGEFIASDRERFVVATKYTLFMRRDDVNASGNHRKNMVQSLEASLKRLDTDYVDLYWVHAWDFMTPVEEVMRALDDMVRAGKVLYVGISDTPAWIVSQANTLADLRGWSRFVGLQVQYNLIERSIERDLLPMARAFDIGVTTWGVLRAGILTGKYSQPDPDEPKRLGDQQLSERDQAIIDEVLKIAHEIGRPPSQVAINWLRQQPGVIIPIIGARTEAHIEDNLACLEFELTAKQLDQFNQVSKIEFGFPHDFLASDGIKDVVFGGNLSRIDNHRVDLRH
ncbi:MAG: aldo/keto reductase [Anaerolineales bacterium]